MLEVKPFYTEDEIIGEGYGVEMEIFSGIGATVQILYKPQVMTCISPFIKLSEESNLITLDVPIKHLERFLSIIVENIFRGDDEPEAQKPCFLVKDSEETIIGIGNLQGEYILFSQLLLLVENRAFC